MVNCTELLTPVTSPSTAVAGSTGSFSFTIPNATKPLKDYQVCWAAPYSFTDKSGALAIDWNDEVFAQSCLTHDGAIRHEATRKAIGG